MFDARFLRWYFLLLLFWIVFQISFLNIIFPDVRIPLAVLASMVTVATLFPVAPALGWSLITVVCFDIFRLGMLTPLVFASIPLVVIINFIANRFSADSRSRFQLRVVFFFVLLVMGSEVILFADWPGIQDIIVAMVIFPVVFYSLHRMQEWLVTSSLVEFRGVR
ncbi:MAG: hypothetical protein E6P95_02585 [Candidatus Moraniibacteriota bacterium]|nr:MAG: hypothetical protein E6P95_02585 [Candidatus Moranbacteria bacterium]